jgi:hypothetical protein
MRVRETSFAARTFFGREHERALGFLVAPSFRLGRHVERMYAAHAFEVPATLPTGSLHDLLTVFLDATHGMVGILNVVNDAGGPSIITNVSTPVTVVSYP